MGQMLQALYAIRHGGDHSTVVGLPFLGDHTRYVLYPLAALALPARALLLGQALALALGAPAVYLLTRDKAGPWVGVVGAGLYLAYPTLQWAALFDLHPEVLATPLLLWAFWAVERRRYVTYGVLVALALTCREDVAVAVGLIGVLLLLERRWRPGLITAGAAAVVYVVDSAVLSAANPGGTSVFEQRYGYLGTTPAELWHNLVLHPGTTFATVSLPLNAGLMVLGFVLPAAPMLLARWTRLLPALPLLVANLLSWLPQQRTIYFHYGFLPSVLIFIAVADGLRVIAEHRGRTRLGLAVCAAVAVLAAVPWTSPFTEPGYRGPGAWPRPAAIQRQLAETYPSAWVAEARAALAEVGDGSVSASANLLPQLAQRDVASMLPNPFYQAWYGSTLTKDLPPSARPSWPAEPPEWVVVDLLHTGPEPEDDRRALLAMLPERYRLVSAQRWVEVWRLK